MNAFLLTFCLREEPIVRYQDLIMLVSFTVTVRTRTFVFAAVPYKSY